MLIKLVKMVIAGMLVIGGLLIGATVFTAKGIDELGDRLQDKLPNH